MWSKKKNVANEDEDEGRIRRQQQENIDPAEDETETPAPAGYTTHAPPVLEAGGGFGGQTGDGGDATVAPSPSPPVMRIPGEEGYFPLPNRPTPGDVAVTGLEETVPPQVAFPHAILYQMHPKYRTSSKKKKEKEKGGASAGGASVGAPKKKRDWLGRPVVLARGALALWDPAPGTADEVALVGECGGLSFYVTKDDAARRVSPTEFVLVLPDDCIGIDLSGSYSDDASDGGVEGGLLRLEGLLAARTRFRDESSCEDAPSQGAGVVLDDDGSTVDQTDFDEVEPGRPPVEVVGGDDGELTGRSQREALVPDDRLSRSAYDASKWVSTKIAGAGEGGAKKIQKYGEAKRASVTETREVGVGRGSIRVANGVRGVSKATVDVVVAVSEKISDAVGGTVGRHAAIRDGDGRGKRGARRLLLSSFLCYAEVSEGVGSAYENMARAAKDESTSFVAKKYGADSSELCRHTAGAAVNFGSAALTARRIVSVKKVVKSSGKRMMEESIKQSIKVN